MRREKASNTPSMSDVPIRKPSWELRREIGPGHFRTYAHGYWRDPFVICVLGRTLVGKRALRRRWEEIRVKST